MAKGKRSGERGAWGGALEALGAWLAPPSASEAPGCWRVGPSPDSVIFHALGRAVRGDTRAQTALRKSLDVRGLKEGFAGYLGFFRKMGEVQRRKAKGGGKAEDGSRSLGKQDALKPMQEEFRSRNLF